MQIPSLPTDNLYKFCAIAGIALFVFGASYALEKSVELNIRVSNDNTQISVMQKQIEFWKEDVDEQKRDVGRVSSDLGGLEHQKHVSREQLDSLKNENNATVVRQAKLIETSRKIQIQAIRLSGEVRNARVLFHNFLLMSIICGLSILVGPWLALFGFRRWYALVQVPQDNVALRQDSATKN